MTSIYKLKKAEYKEGAELAYENFKDLLAIAKLSASKEKYGIASSLCILSIEELSKSVVLELLSINNNIPFLNLEDYFRSHDLKQSTLFNMSSNLKAFDKEQGDNKNLDVGFKEAIVALLTIIALAIWVYENKKKGNFTNKQVSFFNEVKEAGFYIGYNSKERMWQSPNIDFDKDDFEDLLEMTNEISELFENWIFNGKLSQNELFDLLESLDDSVIDKARLKKLKMVEIIHTN